MIRKYRTTDLRALKRLVSESCYWKFFTDDHYTKFVATLGDEVIGVAVVSSTLDTANLDFIYVKPAVRSAGFGQKLLERVEKWCAKNKAEGLGVNCGKENKGAQKFYKRHGFKKVGQVFNYFSNNNMQYFYWKKI